MIIDPIDQKIRDQGFNFVPFDKYLADPFKPYTLDMSGGITTLPKPMFPPIIRRDEGGDGTGGPTTTEEEDEDPYADSPYDQYGNLKGTTPLGALKTAATFYANPIGYLGYKAFQEFKRARQQRQFEKELQNPDFRDMVTENRAAGRGGYQAGYDSGFMDGPPGAGYGNNPGDKGGSDTMGSSKDGGIIGYGGTSGTPLYQQFMNGGLADLVDIYD